MAGKHGIYEKWVKGRGRKSVRLEVLTIFLIFIVIIMGVSLMIYNQNISELRQADINHLTESSKQLAYSVDSIILDVGKPVQPALSGSEDVQYYQPQQKPV